MSKKETKEFKFERKNNPLFSQLKNEGCLPKYPYELRKCIYNKLMENNTKQNFDQICQQYNISKKTLRKWEQFGIERKKIESGNYLKALTNEQESEIESEIMQVCKNLRRQLTNEEIKKIGRELFLQSNFRGSKQWCTRFLRDRDIVRKMNQSLLDIGVISTQEFEETIEKYKKNLLQCRQRKIDNILLQYNQILTTGCEDALAKENFDNKPLQRQESLDNMKIQDQTNFQKDKYSETIEQKQTEEKIEHIEGKQKNMKNITQQPPQENSASFTLKQINKGLEQKPEVQKTSEQKQTKQKEADSQANQVKIPENESLGSNVKQCNLQEIEKMYKQAQDQLMIAQQQFISIQTAFFQLKLETDQNNK